MVFNYNKLRGKIRELYGTQAFFAKDMGMSMCTLSARLNNKVEFTQKEIEKAVSLLQIFKHEIPAYFFKLEVQKTEPSERTNVS